MILTPRWFFVNVQKELEKAGGLSWPRKSITGQALRAPISIAGPRESAEGITGTETIQRYLASMSIRGWGRFKIVQLDEKKGQRGSFGFIDPGSVRSMGS